MNSNKIAEFMNIHNKYKVHMGIQLKSMRFGAELTETELSPGLTIHLALARMEDH